MEKLIQFATAASSYDGAFDSVVGWAAAGMGYILVTEHGHLTVIDGGHPEDAEPLLSLLERCAGGMPTVDYWILTHPHLDHYGALLAVCERPDLVSRIRIRHLVYHFPREFRDRNGRGTDAVFPQMEGIVRTACADVILPVPGQHLYSDTADIHMLSSPTDCSALDNPNQLSLIFTVQLQTSGKKILFTGDAYARNLCAVLEQFPDALKSDILQMPHHGLCDTGHAAFYEAVGADTLLIPISRAGDRTMHSDLYGTAPAVNLAAEARASRVYKAYNGNAELIL